MVKLLFVIVHMNSTVVLSLSLLSLFGLRVLSCEFLSFDHFIWS